ncbi:hypothetical protein PO124_15735 [Bacillus licheniformis]|nr:hypothetical protein [Bacillus licheniformis]
MMWTTKDEADIEIGLHFKEMDKELYVKLIGLCLMKKCKKADRESGLIRCQQ